MYIAQSTNLNLATTQYYNIYIYIYRWSSLVACTKYHVFVCFFNLQPILVQFFGAHLCSAQPFVQTREREIYKTRMHSFMYTITVQLQVDFTPCTLPPDLSRFLKHTKEKCPFLWFFFVLLNTNDILLKFNINHWIPDTHLIVALKSRNIHNSGALFLSYKSRTTVEPDRYQTIPTRI